MSVATDTELTVEKVRNMSLTECLSEGADRWKKAAEIENKYPDGLTQDHAEDYQEAKRLLAELDLIETRTADLEDAAKRKERITERARTATRPAQRHQQPEGEQGNSYERMVKDFGSQFLDSGEYKRVVESGALKNPRTHVEMNIKLDGSLLDYLTRKALIYTGSGVGGPLIVNDRQPGFLEILQRQTTLLDLIPTARTTSNMIEYVQELTFTNSAAEVAEATATTGTTGTKAESSMTFQTKTSPVTTIAHWMPVTNNMLADAPAIEGVIRNRLITGLNLRLEAEIINGDGISPNLQGILGTASVQTIGLAAGATLGGTASTVDAAYAAMNQVMVTGLANPDGFVFHPNDWAAVRLSRENAATGTLGGYQYGPPSVQGPQTLWGRPVVLAIGMPENTLLTGDFQLGCMLFDREEAAIRVGLINDQFTRNMQTILAELRAALTVFRPTAFCRVTGV
jgi:HK97 family phage major capsid protein